MTDLRLNKMLSQNYKNKLMSNKLNQMTCSFIDEMMIIVIFAYFESVPHTHTHILLQE